MSSHETEPSGRLHGLDALRRTALKAGAVAVIQPGGSIRDDDVIKAEDEKGLAMVLTGMRHFRH